MAKKIIIVGDPGIDGAFAASLAMQCPNLDLVGFLPTGGNVTPRAGNNQHPPYSGV